MYLQDTSSVFQIFNKYLLKRYFLNYLDDVKKTTLYLGFFKIHFFKIFFLFFFYFFFIFFLFFFIFFLFFFYFFLLFFEKFPLNIAHYRENKI